MRCASSVRAANSNGDGALEMSDGGSRCCSGCSPDSGIRSRPEDAALAQVIDGEVARDGEEPRLEAGAAVVGAATLQDAQPCRLHQVVDEIAPPEQVDEVADKTKLILLDEVVQQGDVSLTKTACDPLRIGSQGLRQCLVAFKHTRGIRDSRPKLRMDRN